MSMTRIAMFLLVAVACSSPAGTERPAGSTPRQPEGSASFSPVCTTDSDCAAGSGCVQGACVVYPTTETLFAVAVDPGEKSGLLSEQFGGVRIGPGGTVNITMPDPMTVSGVVALQAGHGNDLIDSGPPEVDANAPRVSGRLVATAPGLVPGTQFRSEAKVGLEPDENGVTYTIKVLGNRVYELAFLPDDPALPPYYMSALFTSGRFDILLPDPSEYTRVEGVVVRGPKESPEPVRGARVTASVAQPLGQKSVQAAALTDEQGVFSLIVTGKGAIRLRVEPGKESPLFDPKEFDTGVEAQVGEVGVVRKLAEPLNVGPILPVRRVTVQVVDQDAPVRGALLDISTQGGASLTGATDSNGVAVFDCPEGTYRLAVMPPPGSRVAAAIFPLVVDKDLTARPALSLRPRLKGKVVRGSTGDGVAGAVVVVSTNRILALGDVARALQEVAFEATSDPSGAFELYLDEGRYALTVVPPGESGLARFAHPDLPFGQGNWAVTIPLPEAVLLHGQVFRLDPSGAPEPLASAQVSFFFDAGRYTTIWSIEQDSSFAADVQLAGAAITDAAGRFKVVVPTIAQEGASKGGGGAIAPATGAGPDTQGANASYESGSDSGSNAFGLPDVDVEPM